MSISINDNIDKEIDLVNKKLIIKIKILESLVEDILQNISN